MILTGLVNLVEAAKKFLESTLALSISITFYLFNLVIVDPLKWVLETLFQTNPCQGTFISQDGMKDFQQ